VDRTERFYLIDRLLQARRATTLQLLMNELGVSRSTVKRDLTYMRDRFFAPIIWDHFLQRYRYKDPDPGCPKFSLPGLWFNSTELHALLTMEYLLSNIQPGVLTTHVDPIRNQVRKLLDSDDHCIAEIVHRVQIVSSSGPRIDTDLFQKVTEAVLCRLQIEACYFHYGTNRSTIRKISPQRLVYYNENWYLDGWCHLRDGLRTFRLSNLTAIELTELEAINVDETELNLELTAGFGIFVGKKTRMARLRFDAAVSRWVAQEQWHSDQKIEFDAQQRLVMCVPYSNDPELIMRILQYGPDVEVLKPEDLRAKVASRLRKASAVYGESVQSSTP